jgi:hypothetical protein
MSNYKDDKEQLKVDILRFVRMYQESWPDEAMKAQYVATQFGKRIKRLTGLTTRDWIEASGLFYVTLSKHGGLSFLLKPEFESAATAERGPKPDLGGLDPNEPL